MAMYFRFTSDGKILMTKTIGNKGITEEEFMEKAKEVDFATLLKYCPEKQMDQYGIMEEYTASGLKAEMDIHGVFKNNLSRIGPVISYNPGDGYYCTGCFVGDRFFENAYSDEQVMKEAVEYGVQFYGKDFMKKMMDKGYLNEAKTEQMILNLNKNVPTPYANVHFFTNKTEITKEGYDSLLEKERNFTRIRSTTCPLHDDNSVTVVTPKKVKRTR